MPSLRTSGEGLGVAQVRLESRKSLAPIAPMSAFFHGIPASDYSAYYSPALRAWPSGSCRARNSRSRRFARLSAARSALYPYQQEMIQSRAIVHLRERRAYRSQRIALIGDSRTASSVQTKRDARKFLQGRDWYLTPGIVRGQCTGNPMIGWRASFPSLRGRFSHRRTNTSTDCPQSRQTVQELLSFRTSVLRDQAAVSCRHASIMYGMRNPKGIP